MDVLSKMLVKLAFATAKEAAGAASQWAMWQPQEPALLKIIMEE